ncbi:MAG: radical SAM protein, partial [Candidatus Omnitrophota bacterium]
MNTGFCGICKSKVPLAHIERDGKIYLEKQCPRCGKSYELIANDADMYNKKRAMMPDEEFPGCDLNCLGCGKHKQPNIIFVETTNRCNMNCPICITNVPSMGFEFEPGMEYFDKIFSHYSRFEFPPSIQLFGGEPTMREDLLDIIRLARSYRLSVRLVTNGLKLADPEYCAKIVASGASILISFDGLNEDMYEKLRGSRESLKVKLKALDNISTHKKGKVIMMTVVDKQSNAEDMPKFLDYCLKHSDIVRGIFPMPLTQVWSDERLDYTPERTTQDDVEKIVNNAVEGGGVEFIPLGSLEIRNLARIFKLRHLPFLGVHPNCESFTILISDGEKYSALSRFLKKGTYALVNDIRKLDSSVEKYAVSGKAGFFRKMGIAFSAVGVLAAHCNFGNIVNARGLKAYLRWGRIILEALTGKKIKDIIKNRTGIKSILQIIVLPFEDDGTQESERLQKCSSGYAYVEIETDTVKSVPGCIWEKYKEAALRSNALKYNKEG